MVKRILYGWALPFLFSEVTMDDELKFWFRFCLLMTILFISLFTTITICDCVRTINFTKNNYCEVTVPGNQSLAWQKCK